MSVVVIFNGLFELLALLDRRPSISYRSNCLRYEISDRSRHFRQFPNGLLASFYSRCNVKKNGCFIPFKSITLNTVFSSTLRKISLIGSAS